MNPGISAALQQQPVPVRLHNSPSLWLTYFHTEWVSHQIIYKQMYKCGQDKPAHSKLLTS